MASMGFKGSTTPFYERYRNIIVINIIRSFIDLSYDEELVS